MESCEGSCKIHFNIEIREHATKNLHELEPLNVGNYITLANTYVDRKEVIFLAKVRKIIKGGDFKGGLECSWVVVKKKKLYIYQRR